MTELGPGGPPRRAIPATEVVPTDTEPPQGGLDWLRQLEWRQFEQLVADAYRLQGYEVLPTAEGADGGVDLVLTRGPERIFVQCKHWKAWKVGAPTVRELFGLVVAHRATSGIVVSSGRFSQEARLFAEQVGITLLDGPAVMQLVAAGQIASPAPAHPARPRVPQPGPTGSSGAPSCPICQSPMVVQRARRGRHSGSLFWGCSRFPGCKGVRDIAAPTGTAPPPTAAVPVPLAAAQALMPAPMAPVPGQAVHQQRRSAARILVALVSAVALAGLVGVITVAMAAHGLRSITTRSAPLAPAVARPATAGSSAGPASLSLGEQPVDIAIDTVRGRLYTANFVSGDVSVLDTATHEVVDTLDAPGSPVAVAVDPHGQRIFVADHAGSKIYALDTRSSSRKLVGKTGRGPVDLAFDPKRERLFVANKEDGTVWVYDTTSDRRVGSLKTPSQPVSLAVDSAAGALYVLTSHVVWTYRISTLDGREPRTAMFGKSIAVDTKQQRLYVLSGNQLRETNLITDKTRTIRLDGEAVAVCVDPSARVAYITDPDADEVRQVSLR